tara:strand:- start:2 stop:703 length:702 start_codon:yes stop_codon:yes gene_type:complete
MSIRFSGMILAAGFGKRMLPLTKNLPKPLIEVNGISLLDNAINFLKKLGCNQIIINTHFKNLQIQQKINQRKDKNIITLIHEEELLDTGGAVKNAIPYFDNSNILLINSDVFWTDENINDAKTLVDDYFNFNLPHLLLVEKRNAIGLDRNTGDFCLNKKIVEKYKQGDQIIYYSGLQILNCNFFNNFSIKKFSFNLVWDSWINDKKLCGKVMKSKWYHVGDIEGLSKANELLS